MSALGRRPSFGQAFQQVSIMNRRINELGIKIAN